MAWSDTHSVSPGQSIQAAIDAAEPGDVVVVAQGTYYEAIDFLGKAITVRSTNPTSSAVVQQTVIDGMQAEQVVYFHTNETNSSVLSGLTIKNGKRGVYCISYDAASPTITYCSISANTGPGIQGWRDGVHPVINHCTITANSGRGVAFRYGAVGMVSNCTISGNAGGVEIYDGGTIENNLITDNTTTGEGGGIWCTGGNIVGNRVRGNTAREGGGIDVQGGAAVYGNLVYANTATYRGGGVHCNNTNNLWNNTLCDNQAPASTGGGNLYLYYGSPVVRNCIIAYGKAGFGLYNNSAVPVMSYCNVYGNTEGNMGGGAFTPGMGCLAADPLFASRDLVSPDYRLRSRGGRWTGSAWASDAATSPCVDAGDPAADYGNEPTPNGARVNMGFDGNTPYTSKSGPAPPVRKPDLLARNDGQTTYVGDNLYNATGDGQTKERLVPAGVQAVYCIRLQNDVASQDGFRVKGFSGGSGWTVKYYSGATGTTEVTAQVVSEGGWTLNPVGEYGARDFRAVVTADATVGANAWKQGLITAASLNDPSRVDAVKLRTQRTGALISSVTPGGGATDASRWGPITLQFSQPLQQAALESRFGVTGADSSIPKGRFTWTTPNLKVTWTPSTPLKPSLRYVVRLAAPLTALDGTTLNWSEQSGFTTGSRPVISAFGPQGFSALRDANITVTFSAAMNKSVTQAAFGISPAVAGSFSWSADSKTMTFDPTSALAYDVSYTVKIASTAASAAAPAVTMGYSFIWTFGTQALVPLSIRSVAAAGNSRGGAAVTLSLSSAANVRLEVLNLAGRTIAVLPGTNLPQGVSTLVWNGRSGAGLAAPAGTYLVRVTARDVAGNQVNQVAPCRIGY